jgi:hypothetical protein
MIFRVNFKLVIAIFCLAQKSANERNRMEWKC